MFDVGWSIIAFIVAIGVLVAVHEYGHFWVARRLGFKVLRFSIGFGNPIARFRGRAPDYTEYWISSVPLGGYVKMLDEREAPVPEADQARAFNRRPPPHRIAVLLAGPGFNFLFAIVAYWALFMVGVPGLAPYIGAVEPGSLADRSGLRAADIIEAVDGQPVETLERASLALVDRLLARGEVALTVRGEDGRQRAVLIDARGRVGELMEPEALFTRLGFDPGPVVPTPPAEIGRVVDGQAADRAGLQAGDLITSIDGQPVADFAELAERVRARPGETVELAVQREGGSRTLAVQIGESDGPDGQPVGALGIESIAPPAEDMRRLFDELRVTQRYGPLESVGQAVDRTWEMTVTTLRMLGRMVVGDVSMRNISGPIAIAGYAGDSAQAGFESFVTFLAIVSISLGILNLLPIPILDGGQIVYQAAEWIKGSPVSERALVLGQQVGIVLMVLLMGFVFYNDLSRVFS